MTPEQRTRRMKLNMLMAMSYAAFASTKNAFSPLTLFASGEQGVWYDPSDFSTMFQDSAGTTPVTAVGQPVGKILDKSGRGNHATQGTSASRPVLQQDVNGKYYLAFDGVDDGLATSSITPGTDKAQIFAGLRKNSDAAIGMICEYSANAGTGTGGIALSASAWWVAASARYGAATRNSGGTTYIAGDSAASFAAPITNVISTAHDIAGVADSDVTSMRINGASAALTYASQAKSQTGSFSADILYIGRRGGSTLPFNGRIYGLVVRFGSNLTAAQIAQMEAWMNARTGAY